MTKKTSKRIAFLRDRHAFEIQSKAEIHGGFSRLRRLGAPSAFDLLVAFDPTPKAIYLQRIVSWLISGTIRIEDGRSVRTTLAKFHAAKHLLPPELRDIGAWSSPGDIAAHLHDPDEEHLGDIPQEAALGTRVILAGDGWRLVEETNYAAAQWWGRDTLWCTRFPRMYDAYRKIGPLYVIDNAGTLFQVSPSTGQFMDKFDRQPWPSQVTALPEPILDTIRSICLSPPTSAPVQQQRFVPSDVLDLISGNKVMRGTSYHDRVGFSWTRILDDRETDDAIMLSFNHAPKNVVKSSWQIWFIFRNGDVVHPPFNSWDELHYASESQRELLVDLIASGCDPHATDGPVAVVDHGIGTCLRQGEDDPEGMCVVLHENGSPTAILTSFRGRRDKRFAADIHPRPHRTLEIVDLKALLAGKAACSYHPRSQSEFLSLPENAREIALRAFAETPADLGLLATYGRSILPPEIADRYGAAIDDNDRLQEITRQLLVLDRCDQASTLSGVRDAVELILGSSRNAEIVAISRQGIDLPAGPVRSTLHLMCRPEMRAIARRLTNRGESTVAIPTLSTEETDVLAGIPFNDHLSALLDQSSADRVQEAGRDWPIWDEFATRHDLECPADRSPWMSVPEVMRAASFKPLGLMDTGLDVVAAATSLFRFSGAREAPFEIALACAMADMESACIALEHAAIDTWGDAPARSLEILRARPSVLFSYPAALDAMSPESLVEIVGANPEVVRWLRGRHVTPEFLDFVAANRDRSWFVHAFGSEVNSSGDWIKSVTARLREATIEQKRRWSALRPTRGLRLVGWIPRFWSKA